MTRDTTLDPQASTPAPRGRSGRTQAERREESRRRMLNATFELISERQSSRFTLSEVGERAGYSRGLPSQTFGSKNGLVSQLVPFLLQLSVDETSPIEARGEGLNAVLVTVRQLLEASDRQFRITLAVQVLLSEAAHKGSPIRAEIAALNRIATGYLSKHLRIAVAKGEVRADLDCRIHAMLIMAAVRGMLMQWQVDPERITREALCRETMATLDRVLRP